MKKLIVAVCVALSVTTAKAEFWTGNDLYYSIISTDINKRFQALGYIMGIYDMGIHGAFCPQTEQGITVGQLQDMITFVHRLTEKFVSSSRCSRMCTRSIRRYI